MQTLCICTSSDKLYIFVCQIINYILSTSRLQSVLPETILHGMLLKNQCRVIDEVPELRKLMKSNDKL
jgi:hypothetical protein